MAALLEVRDLHARYGAAPVLHGIDLSVHEGTITALLGANGAGKTTLLRALCHTIRTTGDIRFDGVRIDARATEDIVRLGIAHVPQGRGTFSGLNVQENLRLGAYARKDRASVRQDQERMYALFPVLKDRHRQQAGTLSGGEQQMLAIARALMSRPRLLLLDEPSFGLAPLIVRHIFSVMAKINRDQNVTILLVEQSAVMALQMADHAHLIETGRIVLSGPAAQVAGNELVRRTYLGMP